METGQTIRKAREASELSLRQLAHLIGCSHTALAKIELGEIDPSAKVKSRIARVLRVPFEELWPRIGDEVAS